MAACMRCSRACSSLPACCCRRFGWPQRRHCCWPTLANVDLGTGRSMRRTPNVLQGVHVGRQLRCAAHRENRH